MLDEGQVATNAVPTLAKNNSILVHNKGSVRSIEELRETKTKDEELARPSSQGFEQFTRRAQKFVSQKLMPEDLL